MIKLEPFDTSDYERLIAWINSAETLKQFAGPQFSFPLTASQLDASLSAPNRFAFRVVDAGISMVVGHAEIYIGEEIAYLGRIIIGDKTSRNKGIGQKVIQLLLQKVFNGFSQEKVSLNVFDFNISAIKCYEKCGFEINPDKKITRQINGEQWTALSMVLDKAKWIRFKSP